MVFVYILAGIAIATLLFANLAEASGKAQAATLRKARTDTWAKRLIDPNSRSGKDGVEGVSAVDLQIGDVILVDAGDLIPSDGDVIEGVALSTNRRSPANPRQ